MRQFSREVRAVVGLGSEAITIEGLRMSFEVTKTRLGGSLPNSCELKIYNLAQATRDKIVAHAKSLKLFAGYTGRVELLYQGGIRRSIPTHDGTEWVSTLYGAEALIQMQESTIARTFAAGTSAKQVVESVADAFGAGPAKRSLVGLDGLPAILRPQSLSGSARDAMNALASSYGFDWFFEEGRLQIVGRDSHFEDEAIVISPATGMIGSPSVTDSGVELMTLLNPRLRVKRRIFIESRGAEISVGELAVRDTVPTLREGLYLVSEVVFSGDTHGNDWLSKVKTFPDSVAV